MPGAWLVLPTYNEAENIERIVRAALPRLAEAAPEHRVLVVDDNSPDGTGADRRPPRRRARPRSRCCTAPASRASAAPTSPASGGARGAAPSYPRDGRRLLARPADLPRLIAAASDADLVLGSRYVAGRRRRPTGGSAAAALSRGGSWYARMILGVPVRDLTGGFKCFRRAVLEALDSRERARRRLRLPDRADLPRAQGRLPRGGGADRLPRPPGRAIEDEARIALEAVWKVPALSCGSR